MPSRFSKFGRLGLVAVAVCSAPLALGTSISGDGQTIESTPTPPPSTIRPTPTPEPDEVDEPVPSPQTPSSEKESPARPAQASVSVNQAFSALLREAEGRFYNHDYEAALKKIDDAEALLPGNVNALNMRGAIYAEKGDYESAATFYNQALKIQPRSFWPLYNLAEISFMQKKYSAAREAFTDMLSKFPKNELVQFKILLTFLEEKKEAEAKAALDKVPFLSSTPAYYFSWAAWEFRHNNAAGGKEWIQSGERVFGPGKTRFYNETLADLKMVPPTRPTASPAE